MGEYYDSISFNTYTIMNLPSTDNPHLEFNSGDDDVGVY